jgi:FtsK/SpoIIIE family
MTALNLDPPTSIDTADVQAGLEHLRQVLLWLGFIAVAVVAAVVVVQAWRYARADALGRAVLRKRWLIRATWPRTARRVGLSMSETVPPPWWRTPPPGQAPHLRRRELVPAITTGTEQWGVRIAARTVGRIGLAEFEAAADHLAGAWRVPLVRVEQLRPGVVRIRALLRDPLTTTSDWAPRRGADPRVWAAGIDADGQPVTIRSSGVSGAVVAGLAGYGKTSFLNARFCELAPSDAVQFVLVDGKGGPDYDDLVCRAWLSAKDQPDLVRDHLTRVRDLMSDRQHSIRTVLRVKNMWHTGPSRAWPLIVVVIDEAHTFLNEAKGTDPESKRRDAIARETARLVEELVRKGRNVGIQVVLATQKATGDAIPTRIRDNCQVAVSFAQRTSEAATAVLGADITDNPDEHPRRLQQADYIGVASMVADGRPGFTLVRTPYVTDETAAQVAADTAHLVADPAELLAAATTTTTATGTTPTGSPLTRSNA